MSRRQPLPRRIRGPRPVFFADPAVDKLLTMVLQLAGEVWTLRERVAAMEAIGRANGTLTAGEVDAHEFSPDDAERLTAQRREYLESLFRGLEAPTGARDPHAAQD